MSTTKFYIVLFILLGTMPFFAYSQGSNANLLFNNGDAIYVQAGAVLHVQGDIVNAAGSSSSFINDGLLNVEGDFTNNGTFKTDASVGEGTVRLIGNNTVAGSANSGTQTLSGTLSTIGTGSFYNLVIDGSTTGEIVTLGTNITVTGSMVWNGSSTTANTYNAASFPNTLGNATIMQVRGTVPSGNGLIKTYTNNIYVSNSSPAAVAGYTSSAYVDGYLKRAVASSTSYDLPVGGSHYALANITFGAGLAGTTNLIANFTPGTTTQPNPTTCIINGSKMSTLLNGGYWTIHPDVQPTAGTYTATLYETGYTNAPSAGTNSLGASISPAQQLGLVKRVDGSSPWLGCGRTISGNPSTDQGLGECTNNATISGGIAMVTRTVVPSFSDFAIAMEMNNYQPLPVKMEYFTAEKNGDHSSLLKWATASEIDNAYFEVERSADAATWENLGKVQGAGTSAQQQLYNYTDANALTGVNYYRLKQVDVDGNFTYTNIQEVTFDGVAAAAATTMTMFPNPMSKSGPLTIELSNSNSTISNVTIYNTVGQEVYTGASSNSNTIEINDLTLASGVYVVLVSSEGSKPLTSRLVIK